MRFLKEEANNKENLSFSRDVFVPFVKERDNIGRIIQPHLTKKSQVNALKMFENLKKSTKEYFFEKKYQKMVRKFNFLKRSLEEENKLYYDSKEFEDLFKKSLCFTYLQESSEKKAIIHSISSAIQNFDTLKLHFDYQKNRNSHCESSNEQKENFFIHLQNKINHKIESVKRNLKRKQIQNDICSLTASRLRTKQRKNVYSLEKKDNKIDRRPFSQQKNSQAFMETFCQKGRDYRHLVQQRKFDPWKKWYKMEEIEIFPGKKIKVKNIQKSLYD